MLQLAPGPSRTAQTMTPRNLQAGTGRTLSCTEHVAVEAQVCAVGEARTNPCIDGVPGGSGRALRQGQPSVCSINPWTHPPVAPRRHDQNCFRMPFWSIKNARDGRTRRQWDLNIRPMLPDAESPSPSPHRRRRGRRPARPASHGARTCRPVACSSRSDAKLVGHSHVGISHFS